MTGNISEFPALDIFTNLDQHWGPQQWWPGTTRFEVVVGAILTQNTAWSNVEHAIANLAARNALSPNAIAEISNDELAELIIPSGYYNLKARRLKNFVDVLACDHYDLDLLFKHDTDTLRSILLSVNGIGPETADSILLYAAERPVFVVDAYTRRFMERHNWLGGGESYDEIAEIFSSQLKSDLSIYNQYHALIVRLGKKHCRRQPKCDDCPLNIYALKKA